MEMKLGVPSRMHINTHVRRLLAITRTKSDGSLNDISDSRSINLRDLCSIIEFRCTYSPLPVFNLICMNCADARCSCSCWWCQCRIILQDVVIAVIVVTRTCRCIRDSSSSSSSSSCNSTWRQTTS